MAYPDSPFGQLMLPVVEEVCREQGPALVAKAAHHGSSFVDLLVAGPAGRFIR